MVETAVVLHVSRPQWSSIGWKQSAARGYYPMLQISCAFSMSSAYVHSSISAHTGLSDMPRIRQRMRVALGYMLAQDHGLCRHA